MGANIQVGPSGQLQMLSRSDITINATSPTVPNGLGSAGLVFLGFTEGASSLAVDPYFDIVIGNNPAVRLSIDRNDTEADLLSKLQAVPNLAVNDFVTNTDGFGTTIRLRPGNDYTNPDFGGDLKIFGGPFTTQAGGTAVGLIDDTNADGVADANILLPTGINIISALFGSLSDSNGAVGITAQETSPITTVPYQSETVDGSGVFVSFRNEYLGPNLNQDIKLQGSLTLIDFSQKIVNKQVEEVSITEARFEDENNFRETLDLQLKNETGVNLDEELSNLIIIQTAYAAAARAVNAVDQLFQELLNAIR
jgi:flagellar hook-associated protein 1 FlgK